MPKLKKVIDSDFTTVHNDFIRDKGVSYAAKGLLLVMLSKQDGWNFSIKGLAKLTNHDGETKTNTALNNLIETGYVKRERITDDHGKVIDWEYYFSDKPAFRHEEKVKKTAQIRPQLENPDLENPELENPHLENPHLENPDVENSDLEKPDVEKPDLENHDDNIILYNKRLSDKSIYQSKTGNRKNDRTIDGLAERKMYEEQIKENIEYDWFAEKYEAHDTKEVYGSQELLDSTVEIMLDCMCSTEDIKVGKQFFSPEVVRSRFMKINGEHINHLFERLEKYSESITNIKSYMITALYDVSVTMPIGEHVDIKTMFR